MADKTSTPKINQKKLIPLREAARILDVHKETLRRWDNKGKLEAIRVGPRNDRKYKPKDIIKALQNQT